MHLLLKLLLKTKIFLQDIVKGVVAEYTVDLIHLPLLYIGGMRIRHPEKPF